MIIDSHSHVTLPVEEHLEVMNLEGIEKTILFSTVVHPETASNLAEYKGELNRLYKILRGETNPMEARIKATYELKQTIDRHPNRFIGFGFCPIGMELEQTRQWIETQVMDNDFRGLGEFTFGEGQVDKTENVFKAISDYDGCYPLWFHTFNPLTAKDIRELLAMAQRYPNTTIILGHGSGSFWLETLEAMADLKNVYFDISASFTTHSVRIAAALLPERVLFSVDMPYGSARVMKALVDESVKDSAVRELVYSTNIKNLLNL
jgi:uncharacterized protein